MFFQPLKDLANLMIQSNVNAIINKIIKRPEFTNLIIELNTQGQLYEKGVDSLGVSLGNYAATTIEGTAQFAGRAERGLRFDHITLFDTGDFYKSFKVIIRNESDSFFFIDADPVKEDTNLFQEWGEDIVGLTQESIDVLNERLQTELTKEIKKLLRS
jgi:hypothetical protein